MRTRTSVLLAALPCALLLSACGSGTSDDAGDDTRRTHVVASFYPLAYVTQQVGGDLVDVDNLTSPGGEPHDLELAPKQVAAVQEADLVVFEKGFQSAVDHAVEQAGRDDDTVVDAAGLVTMLPGGEEEGHDHDDDHGHGHAAVDPHLWLDPTNMVTIAQAVADRLSDLDPSHADTYAANAESLIAKLTTLDADYTEGLASCKNDTIVTSHAAFAYLAKHYGLEQVAIAGIDPSNEPSAGQLADITDLVRSTHITTIFTEELVSPAIAKTVADEAGVKTATLDPIEGLSDETKDETYLTLMERNLEAIKKANSCS